ncbi:hypothetical protein ACJ73_09876, partial [Blastomyces percursus]
ELARILIAALMAHHMAQMNDLDCNGFLAEVMLEMIKDAEPLALHSTLLQLTIYEITEGKNGGNSS